jgi:protein O-mannosyl-transferase
MKQWDISEAARRLKEQASLPDTHVVWFLGAGCSISSGIDHAGDLVRRWMVGLRELKGTAFDAWALDNAPGWERNPARYYGTVIDERFGGNHRARQEEIARLVSGREPGFGYACLAQLMTHEVYGHRNNIAFTTNFDDMIADALFLYRQRKALTVVHEALSDFMRVSETTPLVVKLHGDAQLAPKNTTSETAFLDDALVRALRRVLRDAIIVFVGYGGNDESIAGFLEECRSDEVAGALWVGPHLPGSQRLRHWLQSLEGAAHVEHLDFDAFMAELHAEFKLGPPEFNRFDALRQTYERTARRLIGAPGADIGATTRASLSVDDAIDSVQAWRYATEAHSIGGVNPERQELLYRQAVEKAPNDAGILGAYATFLASEGRADEAEELFRRALSVDQSSAAVLANYATLLSQRGRYEEAQLQYERALRIEPDAGRILANYANLLHFLGDRGRAADLYARAVASSPGDNGILSDFAAFLALTGQSEAADRAYQTALAASPYDSNLLANYATMRARLGQLEEAERLARRATTAQPHDARAWATLGHVTFLQGRHDEAEQAYSRSLEIEPDRVGSIGDLAMIEARRGHEEQARHLFDRALAIDRRHPVNLGNLAWLTFRSDRTAAGALVREAQAALPGSRTLTSPDCSEIEVELSFYSCADGGPDDAGALRQLKRSLLDGRRSKGWDFSPVIEAVADDWGDTTFLEALAKVAADEAPIETLDAFPEWRDA